MMAASIVNSASYDMECAEPTPDRGFLDATNPVDSGHPGHPLPHGPSHRRHAVARREIRD